MEKNIFITAIEIIIKKIADTIADAVSRAIFDTIVSKQFVIPNLGPDQKLVYTPEQVAKIMDVSVDSIYNHLLRTHGFPCVKIGSKYVIPAQAFHLWLNSQEKQ